jgi:hypothetical protein
MAMRSPPGLLAAVAAAAPPLSDDRPYNEYFLLRQTLAVIAPPATISAFPDR